MMMTVMVLLLVSELQLSRQTTSVLSCAIAKVPPPRSIL